MKLSNCCGALPYRETDLCSKCKEHADFEEEAKRRARQTMELKGALDKKETKNV